MIKCLAGSLKAALSMVLLAGASSALAADQVATLIGGDTTSGDQATVALDSSVPGAFTYQRPSSGPATATAYLNSHVFCAETPRSPEQISLRPRFQQSVAQGSDVWQFPDVYAHSLVYQGSGFGKAGAPALFIGQGTNLVDKQFRCLTSFPGSSLDFPNVSQGLFDSGFGGNITPTAPTGTHQNVTVQADTFTGFSGLSVSVVKVDTQFDFVNGAGVVWTLVDGFNTSALSPVADATWCGLGTLWVEGATPPPQLCDDSLLVGVVKQNGPFVRQLITAPLGSTPYYVLVYRPIVGVATAGSPKQGFAALRTGGGIVGLAEESQDWYTDDSVWYNY